MEKELASRLTNKLSSQGYIEKNKINIYIYGFELLISTIITLLLMILISAALGLPFTWLFFLLGFIPARIFSGGYHAKTHLICYVVFSVFFALSCVISLLFSFNTNFAVVTSFVLLGILLLFSPVEAENKPLKENSRKKNRMISLAIAGIDIGLAIILAFDSGKLNDFFEIYYISKWILIVFIIYPMIKRLLNRQTKI